MKLLIYIIMTVLPLSIYAQAEITPNNWHSAYVFAAAQRGELETIKQALTEGILAIDSKGPEGASLLYSASEFGRLEVVKFLVQYGADLKTVDSAEALNIAIWNKHNDIAKWLIEAGAPVNTASTFGLRDTPLITATHAKNEEMIAYLLDHGADPNAHGWLGTTALHLAASFGDTGVMEMLLQHGADLDARDSYGKTPLMSACYKCEKESILKLIQLKADAAARDGYGFCASSMTYNCNDPETRDLCAGCTNEIKRK